ncbi:hypothetical protein C482_17413 [Natrialba chahannaoensis JCM 10990]|uniref:Uncharacterized protein n=1 Tax=Natrialba chahannaoensis JCM 10990 TaxID=1227492 RepID=M0A926_9EURY|nr:hypothetical protein [Natrialba chahannaoensis]ELY94876.1 hypothetical protein C482_17413 [Natrialba chahannaoensis JCM 10990]
MTTRVVQQHHPDDINYSLEDVSTDPDAFEDKLSDPTADVKVMDYPLPDGDVRVLYTPGVSGTADDLDREISPAQLEEDLEPMDPTSRVIAIWLLQFFTEMQQEEQENGSELAIYKNLEIKRVPEAINHVSWNGSATDVAGSLMSNLILRHSLPNANHRTGITMAQTYLEAAGANFETPKTHTEEYEWREWVDPYIIESKRLLTVRRHNLYFLTLKRIGCETVRRKHDIEIPLDDYDLDMHYHEAWEKYAELHEAHCIEFAEELATRGGVGNLVQEPALSEEGFIDFLRTENSSSETE